MDTLLPSSEAQVSPENIMKLGTAFFASKTLLSAVELGLFTALGTKAMSADELRDNLGLHERSALDFFDALVALGMLERENGIYRNTVETGLFLDKNKPSYIGGILEMANQRLYGFWGALTTALRTGQPQNEAARGEDLFDTLYNDPARLKLFMGAMSAISVGAAQAIAGKFPWEKYKTVVDVGCAAGCVPIELLRRHEHLRGGGYDLPAVQPIFEESVAAAGLEERLQFHAGDFFKDPLPEADVLIMGHILHDWNMEEKKHLIRSAYEALPKGGALVIYEALIDDGRRENPFGLLMSLNMLIETAGGFDYTGADCSKWLREAGFTETRVEHLGGPDSMVIGIK